MGIPSDLAVSCDNEECNWHGLLQDCDIERDSEGWENPEYEVPVCPKCGEEVDI